VQGWSLVEACSLANVMGGIKIASKGTQNHQPAREQITALLRQHYGVNRAL